MSLYHRFCLFVCVYVCLSLYHPFCLFLCGYNFFPSPTLPVSISLSTGLSVCPYLCFFLRLPVCLSLSLSLSMYLSTPLLPQSSHLHRFPAFAYFPLNNFTCWISSPLLSFLPSPLHPSLTTPFYSDGTKGLELVSVSGPWFIHLSLRRRHQHNRHDHHAPCPPCLYAPLSISPLGPSTLVSLDRLMLLNRHSKTEH